MKTRKPILTLFLLFISSCGVQSSKTGDFKRNLEKTRRSHFNSPLEKNSIFTCLSQTSPNAATLYRLAQIEDSALSTKGMASVINAVFTESIISDTGVSLKEEFVSKSYLLKSKHTSSTLVVSQGDTPFLSIYKHKEETKIYFIESKEELSVYCWENKINSL